jgi:basic membrane protein A
MIRLPPLPRTLLALASAATLLTAAGCSRNADGAPPAPRLGLVTDEAGLADQSFNAAAYAGLTAAKDLLHADITAIESRSPADYESNVNVLAVENYDEVYAAGYPMSAALDRVARSYPKRHFALLDGSVEEPNVSCVVFRDEEGAFLAGALAAMTGRTRTLGFLGGVDVPQMRRFEAGFTAGAKQIDPGVRVLAQYAGSFNDEDGGKRIANALFDRGASVVFVAAGKTGLGAIDALRARPGVYGIGADSDQDALAKGKILTSVLKRLDLAVFRLAQDTISEKQPSGTTALGLREGGIALTPFTYSRAIVKPAMIARLRALRAAIVAGTIVPPRTREAAARFKPVSTIGALQGATFTRR